MNGNTTCLWRCLAWSGPFQRVICRDSQTHVISTKAGKERNTDRKTCLCSWREAAASVGVAPIEWWTIKEKHHGIHRAGSRFASSSRLVFDFPSALLPTESGWTGGEGKRRRARQQHAANGAASGSAAAGCDDPGEEGSGEEGSRIAQASARRRRRKRARSSQLGSGVSAA